MNERSGGTTRPSSVRRIRLEEVLESTPAESEEERRVMQSLEQSNETGTSSRFFDAATSIPEDVASHTSNDMESSDERDRTQRRANRVGGKLYQLTNSINLMHMEMQTTSSTDGKSKKSKMSIPGKIYDVANENSPSTDRFAANAGKIYERFRIVNGKKSKKRSKKGVRDGVVDIESQHSDSGKGISTKALKKKVVHKSLESMHEFQNLVVSRRRYALTYISNSFFFIVLPSTILAAILYYFFGNPMAGESLDFKAVTLYISGTTDAPAAPNSSGTPTAAPISLSDVDEVNVGNRHLVCKHGQQHSGPSTSWWILFIGVRQVMVVGLARASQFLIMTFALKINIRGMVGQSFRLYLLQARGWPFVMILWSVYNFILLNGPRRFSRHWLYFQKWVEVFNECNPAGSVTSAPVYRELLGFAIILSLLVTTKRFWIGLRFGKLSYFRYAEKLSEVLKDQLMISKVAKNSQIEYFERLENHDLGEESVLESWYHAGDDDDVDGNETGSEGVSPNDSPRRKRTASVESAPFLTESQNLNIEEMIGAWEELDIDGDSSGQNDADLTSIIQFRASLSVLESTMPYSPAFGEACTRSEVIKRSEALYKQLLKKQEFLHGNNENDRMPAESSILRFHTIALTALKNNGTFDRRFCKDLVKLFRPARNGNISKVEFCKSIDAQYKEMRKLRATIANEGRVNNSSETIINIVFYFVAAMAGLAVLGINPIALFGVLASFILGFSFMISGASSDYFRGLLFITVQRPYDIGDRVNVADPKSASSGNGSPGWIVKDVNLYHTTFLYGSTMEYATISNGALSSARIINGARAKRPFLNFTMKFGLNVPAETIAVFKEEIIANVKSKPREWNAFLAFRLTSIEANLGYVAYIVVAEHRESWQQIGALLNSLADLQAFAFELSKELKMGYKAPTMPIELSMMNNNAGQQGAANGQPEDQTMPPLTSFYNSN